MRLPDVIKALPDQLNAVRKTWRAYRATWATTRAANRPPVALLCSTPTDHTQSAEAPSAAVPLGDQYAARHNPFVYFHSIVDSPKCDTGVVNLNLLAGDLKSDWTTPNFVFITPTLCDDGHDGPCVNGQPGDLVSADAFLQTWSADHGVAGLQEGRADRDCVRRRRVQRVAPNPGGVFIISAPGLFCCNAQAGPDLSAFPQSATFGAFTLTFQSYGGDRTGAVLLSAFIKPGTVANTPFKYFSLLKSLEDIFDTEGHLGYASQPGLLGFFGPVTSDTDAW